MSSWIGLWRLRIDVSKPDQYVREVKNTRKRIKLRSAALWLGKSVQLQQSRDATKECLFTENLSAWPGNRGLAILKAFKNMLLKVTVMALAI